MEKIKNLSIRKTIILYMGINLLLCFFISSFIIGFAEKRQSDIWWKYTDKESFYEASEKQDVHGKTVYRIVIPRVSGYNMTKEDAAFSELCDFLQTWSMPLVSSIGIIAAVFLFHHKKIKKPLQELMKGSEMISNNTLDFSMKYSNEDELGRLCMEFEKMRVQLLENNHRLWGMVEEQKALKAAIAHDIRSPLAILSGYQEMLLEFVPQEKLDKEKVGEILCSGMQQINRLQEFADTMLQLSRLEDRVVKCREIHLEDLKEQIEMTAQTMLTNTGKQCEVRVEGCDKTEICVDSCIVLEVVENLVSNGLRYADRIVDVSLLVQEDNLEIRVRDDGAGFQEEPERLMQPYYHANTQDNVNHFGLGLYICRVYCERHGGRLILSNQTGGGAQAVAVFLSDCI